MWELVKEERWCDFEDVGEEHAKLSGVETDGRPARLGTDRVLLKATASIREVGVERMINLEIGRVYASRAIIAARICDTAAAEMDDDRSGKTP